MPLDILTCLQVCGEQNHSQERATDRKHLHLIWHAAAAAAKSLQSCPTLCDPIDAARQALPSLGFSRQEHWSGLPFPSPVHESGK